jgi:hypothetical protein
VDLALQRMTKAEADVEGFGDLDARIDAHHIASGKHGSLPYALESASKERAAAIVQLEQATRAHTALAIKDGLHPPPRGGFGATVAQAKCEAFHSVRHTAPSGNTIVGDATCSTMKLIDAEDAAMW